MIDVIAYLGLLCGLCGQWLIGRSNSAGWVVRVLGGSFWLLWGSLNESIPIVLTSTLYLSVDLYGMQKAARNAISNA